MDADLNHAIGSATERRFLRLMRVSDKHTPRWLIDTTPAGLEWDSRGVDFFMYLAHRKGGPPVKVPVQIKSSVSGAEHFRRTHSRDRVRFISLFVVKHYDSDGFIRHMVYQELRRIRRSEIRYDQFYKREIARAESHWKS